MRLRTVLIVSTILVLWIDPSNGQPPPNPGNTNSGNQGDIFTDPRTGITWRKVLRTFERPVMDQQFVTQQQTYLQPELVTTTRPLQRTLMIPVTQYELQTKWHGRWNPFVQPSLGYHYVPRTRFEPRVETIHVPSTETRYLQKTEMVQVPSPQLRVEKREEYVWERISTPGNMPGFQDSRQSVAGGRVPTPFGNEGLGLRNSMQRGMPATELGSGTNPGIIATAPAGTMWR
jgi:hypothetical protein